MYTQSQRRRIARNRICRSLKNKHEMRVEALERRECPAVLFDYSTDSGLLKITGDDGPNNIEVVSTDRTVQVSADGDRRVFRGVTEVFVDAGKGNDRIQTRQTTLIVEPLRAPLAVTSRIHSGPGDDYVAVSDINRNGVASTPSSILYPLSAEVDLGSGSDEVFVELRHHDTVDLDLVSDDGADAILVSMLLPAVQKIRAANAEVDLDLGGGGNLVDVKVENFDDVSISAISAEPSPSDAKQSDVWQIKHKYSNVQSRLSVAILDLDLALGSANDTLDITTAAAAMDLDIKAGAGNDTVTIHDSNKHRLAGDPISGPLWKGHIDLGTGQDRVNAPSLNHSNMDLNIVSSDGDDTVQAGILLTICLGPNGQSFVCGARAALNVDLSGGNNRTDLQYRMGDGSVRYSLESNLPSIPSAAPDLLGSKLRFQGILLEGSKHPTIEFDALLGDGDDLVEFQGSGLKLAKTALQSGGGDDLVDWGIVNNVSLEVAAVDAVFDSGAGNDNIKFLTRNMPNVQLELSSGSGDDLVRVGSRGDAKSKSWAGRIDLGDGDNRLDLKAERFPQVTADLRGGGGRDWMWVDFSGQPLITGARSQLNVSASLGAGSDQYHLRSQGFHDFESRINTGPRGDGQDVITTQHLIQPPRGPISKITRSVDGDQATFLGMGYSSHNVSHSQGGDLSSHEVGHWVGN